ncbi:HlyD family secretion protein [Paramaledivibacter caminithermalis]|uniref:HlyD family secretion protein n=1 Tax=Paramaledivibacter caminithermalis (strain DSM 15212 / CIP 107654 / DViRD3) TaxID=1121301 RepID=A0A1M6KE35_PARC5|nr:HlyD family efflux transporter periplasmic adaptor subunit [Paramaledivibacter caminithermalis]SHJ57245.1 HlyD family secretion protein [Paramaledivibacter caminithermalis DSM 15212]
MRSLNKYIFISMCLLLLLMTGCSAGAAEKNEINVFNESEGIVAQGVIEAKEVSINSKIPGRIGKIYVEEGVEIEAGQLLVEISSDELQAKKEQALALVKAAEAAHEAAKGQVKAAKSLLAKAQNGAREQEIAKAQAYYDLMASTYERVEKLFEKGAVSEQKKDEVKTQLEVAKQTLSMAKEGARSEDISSAEALVTQALSMEQAAKGKLEQAQAGLQEVEAYLKDTKISAPINGVITQVNADEGELVSTGMSIATITNLNKPWVEVKIKETDLEKISLGQEVKVKVPSFSEDIFKGKVVRINKKPDFATKRATNDNGDFDIISFGVKIQIENNDKVLRPGMTAFVQFLK